MPLYPKDQAQVMVAMLLDEFVKSTLFENTWYCKNWPQTCRYAITADPEFVYEQDHTDRHNPDCQYG